MTPQNHKTILLVEDEGLIALMEKEILKRHGFHIIVASSGEKAITTVQNTPDINLILMDINLGKGMDGTEAAEIILKDHDIPILFLSSYTQPEIVNKTERITSYGYVVKDSGETVLITSIKMAFKLHEAHQGLKESEKALQSGEEKYRLLFENAVEGIFQTTPEGKFISANPAQARLIGFDSPQELMDQFTDIARQHYAHPEDRQTYKNTLEREGIIKGFETLLLDKNGNPIWASISARAIRDAEGVITSYEGTVEDITERKRVEEELREHEETFRRLFEDSTDPVLLLNGDSFVDCNSACVVILGYTSKDELIKKHPWDISPQFQPDGRLSSEKAAEVLDFAVCNGHHRFEWIHLKSDGTEFPVEVMLTPLVIRGTHFLHVVWRDITDRKQAEEELRKKEAEYRRIVETSIEGIIALDSHARMTLVNRQMASMLGYTIEELFGRKIESFLAEEELCDHHMQMDLRRQGKGAVYERCFQRKDGGKLWTTISSTVCNDPEGRFEGSFAMLSDITERKQTEIALKESEERYRIAIEASNDGIAIVQNDAHVYVNQSFLTMFGYSALEEIVGKQNYCIVHPDHKERVIEYARARQKGEHAPTRYEFKGIKKDGTPVDIEVSVNTISYNGKQAILAYLRDNTERKKTENDLIYLGTHDPLTGLFNRTFFQTELERLQDSRLYPISIIMADVNGLKDVNDHLGHLAGDELLREVGSVIHKTFRAEEIIARIGGDEFVILLPGIDQTGAEKAIIRLQVHIAEHNHTNPDLQISLAAGYATGEANIALEELLHLADNEMYRIKAIQKQIKLEDKVL